MISGNILLVDDDDDDQFIFKDALKREISFPYDCLVARNGLEAIDILDREKTSPSIIFLDLNMPIMNGVEFLSVIKKHPKFKHIPVNIFSTTNNPLDKQNLTKLGAIRFITKSSDFKYLKDKLREILNFDAAVSN